MKNNKCSKNTAPILLNYPNSGSTQKETESSLIKNPFSKSETTNFSISEQKCVPEKNIFNSNIPQKSFYDTKLLHSVSNSEINHEIVKSSNSKSSSLIVEKSLKTSITIESDHSLADWNIKLSDPKYLMQSMKNPGNDNLITYYRYPDIALPSDQKKCIHKALSKNSKKVISSEENLIWYRMFSEKWRKSLLSAFETLKYGFINNFYFIQEDVTILFERNPQDFILRAYLQLSSLALKEDLRINGIIKFSKKMNMLIF